MVKNPDSVLRIGIEEVPTRENVRIYKGVVLGINIRADLFYFYVGIGITILTIDIGDIVYTRGIEINSVKRNPLKNEEEGIKEVKVNLLNVSLVELNKRGREVNRTSRISEVINLFILVVDSIQVNYFIKGKGTLEVKEPSIVSKKITVELIFFSLKDNVAVTNSEGKEDVSEVVNKGNGRIYEKVDVLLEGKVVGYVYSKN